MATTSNVNVLLALRYKQLGLSQALDGIKGLAGRVAGLAAAYVSVNQAVQGVRNIAKLGAEVQHLSQRTGLAVASVATWKQALEDAGGSAEKLGVAARTLQKNLFDATTGRGAAKPFLDRLGMSAVDLARMSPEGQLDAVAQALAGVNDRAQQTAAAMALFGDAGQDVLAALPGLADAEQNLGRLPEILARNAVGLEELDTKLARTGNKARQFWAGVTDMTLDAMLEPVRAFDRIDFTGLGQKVGAYIAALMESFRDGKLSDFIGLSIRAGFEKGMKGLGALWDGFWSGDFQRGLWKAIIDLSAGVTTSLIGAFKLAVAYASAAFRWLGSQVAPSASIAGLELAYNDAVRAGAPQAVLARYREQIEQARVELANSQRAAFDSLLDEQRAGLESLTGPITDFIRTQQAASKAILDGAEAGTQATASVREATSAWEELQALMAEQRLARELGSFFDAVDYGADGAKASAQSPMGDTGQPSAADPWTAARAGLEDYIARVGTVAEQIQSTVGGIAQSISSSIGSSIMSIIQHTGTWADMLRNIATSVIGGLIQSLVNMVTQWIAQRLLMHVFGTTLQAASTAQTAAAGAAATAAWAPAAVAAAIATLGTANIAGAAAQAQIAASRMMALPGFSDGGYTGEKGGIVHPREFVLNAMATDALGRSNLDYMNRTGQMPVAKAAASGGSGGRAPSAAGATTNISVIPVYDQRDAFRIQRRLPESEHHIVSTTGRAYGVNKRRHAFS